jgi:hypothetical protein
MRNTKLWDKGIKLHSVFSFLFRNDKQVMETILLHNKRPAPNRSENQEMWQNGCIPSFQSRCDADRSLDKHKKVCRGVS